jgi:hypothetical protein
MGSTGTSPDTVPDNNVLAQAPSKSSGNVSYSWEEFVFSTPYECSAETEYFIVAEGTGVDPSNCWVWYIQATGAYDYGDYAFNSGSGWTASVRDCYFRAYGTPEMALPNITIQGANGERLGISVASAGDFNDDGYADVIVGAPFNDSEDGSISLAGAAYVFCGSPTMTNKTVADADNVSYGQRSGDRFGWSVAMAGNVDGDGYFDVIIGAPYFNNGTKIDAGKVYIMSSGTPPVIPEFSSFLIPLILILLIIAISRRRWYYTIRNEEVIN